MPRSTGDTSRSIRALPDALDGRLRRPPPKRRRERTDRRGATLVLLAGRNSGDVLPRDQRQTEVKLNAAARELDLLRERLEGRVEESPGMQALRQAPSRAGSST
jgi:hypothetical protein